MCQNLMPICDLHQIKTNVTIAKDKIKLPTCHFFNSIINLLSVLGSSEILERHGWKKAVCLLLKHATELPVFTIQVTIERVQTLEVKAQVRGDKKAVVRQKHGRG